MEGLEAPTPFARLVAESLADQQFTLFDIGCSSGIDSVWRIFGSRLRAFGFDPNLDEIARLTAAEDLPGVTYFPAFVGLPADDPGFARLRARDFWARNPWARLSVARTLEIRAAAIAKADETEKTKLNLWTQVRLADPDQAIVIPQFLKERGINDIDFIKIDVDGPDFLLLRSLAPMLDRTAVLGVGVEVNFFGSDDREVNTFHNVDRLMKGSGFELFSLSSRPYSMAALPAPYQFTVPAQSLWGRPLQGDAIYLRDAVAPENAEWSIAKGLAKLAALFSLIQLPDCAAELLTRFGKTLAERLDIREGLDLLTAQCIPLGEQIPTFSDYTAEFEVDSGSILPRLKQANTDFSRFPPRP